MNFVNNSLENTSHNFSLIPNDDNDDVTVSDCLLVCPGKIECRAGVAGKYEKWNTEKVEISLPSTRIPSCPAFLPTYGSHFLKIWLLPSTHIYFHSTVSHRRRRPLENLAGIIITTLLSEISENPSAHKCAAKVKLCRFCFICSQSTIKYLFMLLCFIIRFSCSVLRSLQLLLLADGG